jgi:hypothetical protein
MAIYLRSSVVLELYGDGTSTVFAYDLSKPPISSGGFDNFAQFPPFAIGTPTQIEASVTINGAPQVGVNPDGTAVLDVPGVVTALSGTVLTLTFSRALLQLGTIFTDGNSVQWPVNSPYNVEIFFDYNSVS